MWLLDREKKNGEYTVYFECKVVETQTVVIGSGAYVKLHNITYKANTTTTSVTTNTVPAKTVPSVDSQNKFACDQIFNEINLKLKQNPDISKSINKIYAFRITKQDETKLFSNN